MCTSAKKDVILEVNALEEIGVEVPTEFVKRIEKGEFDDVFAESEHMGTTELTDMLMAVASIRAAA